MATMLKDPPIATNVKVRIIMYKALTFRKEINIKEEGYCSIIEKDFGNVYIDDKFLFEYTIK